jgi:antirestriction protein ArdC
MDQAATTNPETEETLPAYEPQINATTCEPYHGKNAGILQYAQVAGGYAEPVWITFQQALAIGRCVRKGEHGVGLMKVVEKVDGTQVPKRFTVFNIAQTDELVAKVEVPA